MCLILIFKILLMLMECSILLLGNTVEWQGGDIYSRLNRTSKLSLSYRAMFSRIVVIPSELSVIPTQ